MALFQAGRQFLFLKVIQIIKKFKTNDGNFYQFVIIGIGLSMNIVNAYVNIYYNMIIGYSLYYLVMSFRAELPWAKCNPSWSSPSKHYG